MTATRGVLATIEPCADPQRTSCDWEPGMLRSCHRCRGDLTRTVLHPDTPAISVEAALDIIADTYSDRCEMPYVQSALEAVQRGIEAAS